MEQTCINPEMSVRLSSSEIDVVICQQGGLQVFTNLMIDFDLSH